MPANIDINELEKMAKFRLNEDERIETQKYMELIAGDLDKLSQTGTDNVRPLVHGIELTNIFREDKAEKKIEREDLLRNAPEQEDGYFKVPKTIE